MKGEYDVVVVGAGPAGSVVAKTVATGGFDVLMVEKRAAIGEPIRCAGGVMRGELVKFMEPGGRWVTDEIKGFRVYAPDGNYIEFKAAGADSPLGYVLDRKVFDQELARRAAVNGVEVLVKAQAVGLVMTEGFVKGVKIDYLGEEKIVYSKLTIGADGVESRVGRWVGLDTGICLDDLLVGAQYLIVDDNISPYCELFLGREIAPGGYTWVLPRYGGLAGVGVCVVPEMAAGVSPMNYLEHFLERRFPNCKRLELVVGGIPVGGGIKRMVANGLMIVGDAAHQAEPIVGGGIAAAMEAGKLAGEVAIEALKAGDFSERKLLGYQRRWHEVAGKTFRRHYKVRRTLMELKDEELNSLAQSLNEMDLSKPLRLMDIVKMLVRLNPKILWRLYHLF